LLHSADHKGIAPPRNGGPLSFTGKNLDSQPKNAYQSARNQYLRVKRRNHHSRITSRVFLHPFKWIESMKRTFAWPIVALIALVSAQTNRAVAVDPVINR
jgi:hypothetical protein